MVRLDMLARLLSEQSRIVFEQLAHGMRHGPRVERPTQAPGVERHQLRQRTGTRGDHRNTAGHGFERHQAEGLLITGMQQHIATGHVARHFAGTTEAIDHRDVVRHPLRHARTHQQQVVRLTELARGFQQDVQVLLPRTAPGKDHQPGVVGQAQLAAQIGVAALGAEGVQINPQRLHEDVLHAEVQELVGHHFAGCQHSVETSVQL